MKILIAVTTAFLFLSFGKMPFHTNKTSVVFADTSHVDHVLDGLTAEWPDSIFHTEKETLIRYATDNNGQNLFLAMRIPDFRTQMKIMQGMKVFIDLKGKKKENRGIEYPVKPEGAFAGNMPAGTTDKKEMRASMSFHLFAMKVFGFTDIEPFSQGLQMPNSVNIAFNWDSSDVLHIEYLIPLNMLDDINSLRQKTISIGWKIYGAQAQNGNVVTVTSVEGREQGTGRTVRGPRTVSSTPTPVASTGAPLTSGEENFWTKHTLNF